MQTITVKVFETKALLHLFEAGEFHLGHKNPRKLTTRPSENRHFVNKNVTSILGFLDNPKPIISIMITIDKNGGVPLARKNFRDTDRAFSLHGRLSPRNSTGFPLPRGSGTRVFATIFPEFFTLFERAIEKTSLEQHNTLLRGLKCTCANASNCICRPCNA